MERRRGVIAGGVGLVVLVAMSILVGLLLAVSAMEGTPRFAFPAMLAMVGLYMWAGWEIGSHPGNAARYCTAELSLTTDTLSYLRENRECTDIVLRTPTDSENEPSESP